MEDLRKRALSNTNLRKLGNTSEAVSAVNSGTSTPSGLEKTDSVLNLTRPSLYGIYQENSALDLNRDESDLNLSATMTKAQFSQTTPDANLPDSSKSTFVVVANYSLHLFMAMGSALIYNEVTRHINASHFNGNDLIGLPLSIANVLIFSLFDMFHVSRYFGHYINISETADYVFALTLEGLFLATLHPLMDKILPKSFSKRLLSSNPDPNKKNFYNDTLRASITFLGISYAIRKIDWTSFLQISTIWSLLNPGMWLLLDGSISGFISSVVGSLIFCSVIYSQNQVLTNQFMEIKSTEDVFALWLWICSFFFCGFIIFGKIGRNAFGA